MKSENETFDYTSDANDDLHRPMHDRESVRVKNRKVNKLAKKARRNSNGKRK